MQNKKHTVGLEPTQGRGDRFRSYGTDLREEELAALKAQHQRERVRDLLRRRSSLVLDDLQRATEIVLTKPYDIDLTVFTGGGHYALTRQLLLRPRQISARASGDSAGGDDQASSEEELDTGRDMLQALQRVKEELAPMAHDQPRRSKRKRPAPASTQSKGASTQSNLWFCDECSCFSSHPLQVSQPRSSLPLRLGDHPSASRCGTPPSHP